MFQSLSARSRSKKLALFWELLHPTAKDCVLDIGGESDPSGSTIQLCDNYPFKERLTIANISIKSLQVIRQSCPQAAAVAGRGELLPFQKASFDIAFSNAVIEHLYTWDNQQMMADEIRRVSKRWFVTTPNRWYPFEFHARLPLVSWLPPKLLHRTANSICWNHVSRRYVRGIRLDELHLLTKRQLARLFPDSIIIPIRVTFWAETLVAVGPARLLKKTAPSVHSGNPARDGT